MEDLDIAMHNTFHSPHFRLTRSPMARFEPTEYGKWLGVQLAKGAPEKAA
jgi:hypothetical protein